MPSNNTNNSLSDLENDGHDFNRLLSKDEISAAPDIEKLKRERESLVKQSIQSTGILKKSLEDSISKKEKEISKASSKTGNTTTDFTEKSLFDRDAVIDYGRFSGNQPWKEYKKGDKGEFIKNYKYSINTPVPSKDASLDAHDGLSVDSIVKWSEKYPAMQLRYQDFVYCKRLGYYPNNRLIVLRRFKGGVPDNLFDYFNKDTSKIEFTQPLATMVTWLKPDDDIIDMTFNEEWEPYHSSFLTTIKNSINNFLGSDSKEASNNWEQNFSDLALSLAFEESSKNSPDFRREDGVPYTRAIMGNPNLISSAMKRKTGGDGLSSTIRFTVSFEYELRFINDIDPGIAMLDLLSNAMRMGTSESEFKYNIPFVKNNINKFIQGDISAATEIFKKCIKTFSDEIEKSIDFFKTSFNNIKNNPKKFANDSKKIGENAINNALSYILSRYRESLKAALSVDTGISSGIWHLSIGVPSRPIISCGDLIVDKSEIKLGKEFGYNDFPNSFAVIYTLKSARQRGRNEISRIFNAGRGRLYVYSTFDKNSDYDQYPTS